MIPAIVQWELTSRCNYSCKHCYRNGYDNEQDNFVELSDQKMKQVAQILINHRLFFITLTGGEPLMRKKLITQIDKMFFEYGIKVSLNTNLVLVEKEILEELHLHGMLISCPSANSKNYAVITGRDVYQKFEHKLRLVINMGIHHTVNMVVSNLNKHEVRLTACRMAELGVLRFAATPASLNASCPKPDLILNLHDFKRVIEDLIWIYENLGMQVDIMEALPKCVIPEKAYELNLPFVSRSCFAGKRNGTISPTGNVRPCGHNPQIFGNILNDEISNIWDKLQNWRSATNNQHTNCLACDIKNSCDGGCQFSGHPISGKISTFMSQSIKELEDAKRPKKVVNVLDPDMFLRPYENIVDRKEDDGTWLLCSNSSRNLIVAGNDLYLFIQAIKNFLPLKLKEIAKKFNVNPMDDDFQLVIKKLIDKNFLIPTSFKSQSK